jgi:NADH-quinone oxidoreductase subunit L
MAIVAVVGVLTALMAASIGLVQYDIKRVLAYSTVSQLGYMFTAMGVGAFSAGAFHLMTHAFFKALLFLGSGSVIHAMGGEQDMRHMGGLRKYLPVTYATMFVGTLAIAGIPPFAGFFSKDEILYRAFQHNHVIWVLAVATALMTAFYMFRLVAMTFLGGYRGPAWDTAGHASVSMPVKASARDTQAAAVHGAAHPADLHAHGHAAEPDHEVAHGPAEPHGDAAHDVHDDAHGGHGHGPWHGPHESPRPMTFPLIVLAIGAVFVGFFGIPGALGGGNAIEHFLEPSFTASESHVATAASPAGAEGVHAGEAAEETEHASRGLELGLMALSVFIAAFGIWLANKFYVTSPEISESLKTQWAGAHRTLSNKYYVDEVYNATVVAGTFAGGRGLWTFDRRVVDGAVNGTSWMTVISAWFSGLTDRTIVDGLVNLVGRICEEGSFWFRKVQSGLVQNYALLMLFGVFAFVTVYLFSR